MKRNQPYTWRYEMRIQARNLGCAGLALAALLASDVTVMTAGSLPGSEARRLSAQETEVHNRQDEERMFLEARRALNREEFDRAAELFQALRDKYPVSNTRTYGRFVPDSYYWEAFGRYREGDLPEALILLDLVRVYREAQYYRDGSTWREGRLYDDVRELRLRIQRQLAEEGDPDAAEEVLRHSEAVLAMDSTEILEMQRQFAENIANMQARWEEAQARFTPDMAAYREMQRQFEARIRELEDVWTGQQARLERELQQSIERYRAQLDSTGCPGGSGAGPVDGRLCRGRGDGMGNGGLGRCRVWPRCPDVSRAGGTTGDDRCLLRSVRSGPGRNRHPPGVRGRAD